MLNGEVVLPCLRLKILETTPCSAVHTRLGQIRKCGPPFPPPPPLSRPKKAEGSKDASNISFVKFNNITVAVKEGDTCKKAFCNMPQHYSR